MKKFKKIVCVTLVVHLFLLLFVILKFQVDDMTLSKGQVYDFNEGWTLTWEDGKNIQIEKLPFLGKSKPGTRIRMENKIPKEFYGKTMSFLSADKNLKVWIDGKCIYEFGISDKRTFGHTPGSVVNFIDIPYDLTEGKISIEMVSPYADYASRVTKVSIGNRDVLILQLLQDNIFNIACNFIILISGIIFVVLFFLQKMLKKNTDGIQYLSGYCIVASLYYSIETKVLHIFYGNQTFYSVSVFLCLMLIPFFIGLYYGNGILGIYKKRWKFLLGLICVNIGVQMVLQLLNIVDFMNMAFCSHTLIMVTILVVLKSYLDIIKENKDIRIRLAMAGLLFMGIGGAIDIVRMYIVAVGDMGKFSRFGTMIYSMIMLIQHVRIVVQGYTYDMEKSAILLQNEMEELEKKNQQLEQANALAEEARKDAMAADVAKGKFLAHMSHEIRTPINAVLGMDTMILRETTDAQIKEYALDIQNAGKNLLALVNDILDFSKIESGKLEVIQVEYDFSSLLHDISNMVKAKADAKKLELKICANENLPSCLLGDDVRIRQILVNLLNNAIKYTSQGSVTLKIDGSQADGKVVMDFSVEDTGIGIKEEDIHKLFKEFERIEEKRNRHIEGTGLGMNITVQLLNLMNSKIQVESVYGKGSRFYFTLEQQIVDSTPIGNLEERIRKHSMEYEYMSAFIAPEAWILVVDDNLMNLKVFVGLLKRTKINIDVVDSGKGCLEMIEKKHYDLIFLDHMMPEMDGIETLHHMKDMKEVQTSLNEHTPVVALTANAITGAKEMYLQEGFDAFLPKPVSPDKLEQMILRLLPRDLLQFEMEEEIEESTVTEKTDFVEETTETVKSTKVLDDVDLPIVDGVDWSYGWMHLPSKQLLMEMIEDFYKAVPAEADILDGFYKKSKDNPEELKNYRIKVHAMKSSANLIGATMLGGMAKFLENAATNENLEQIDAVHNLFLNEWRNMRELLKECISQNKAEEEPRKNIEDYTEILGYLQLLQSAFEELDMDEMDRIMGILEEFQYNPEVQAEIEDLSIQVVNMDSEQGIIIIEKLIKILLENYVSI